MHKNTGNYSKNTKFLFEIWFYSLEFGGNVGSLRINKLIISLSPKLKQKLFTLQFFSLEGNSCCILFCDAILRGVSESLSIIKRAPLSIKSFVKFFRPKIELNSIESVF